MLTCFLFCGMIVYMKKGENYERRGFQKQSYADDFEVL